MNRTPLTVFVLAAAILLSSTASAQKAKSDLGKKEFELECAICHGMDAKGSGFYVASLKVAPPDLTSLAKKNGGVLPVERITRVIDGRVAIAAHGSRDMPIWGTRYAINAAEHYVDAPYDQESYVRAQILTLIDYLNRLQQK